MTQPPRYEVNFVAPHAFAGEIIPRIVTFAISQTNSDSSAVPFDAPVAQ
jgi:hypothetical protein